MLYFITLYYIILYFIILYYIILYYIILYYIILYYIILYYIILYYIILYYIQFTDWTSDWELAFLQTAENYPGGTIKEIYTFTTRRFVLCWNVNTGIF